MSGDREPQGSATGAGDPRGAEQASDDELRAAYEEELNRITSAELMLQSAVSLLNVAGRRLGLAPAATGGGEQPSPAGERDLEQVREAIDGVRALFGVLERRFGREIAPLRDALSQLQLAYAREAQAAAQPPGAQGAGDESPPSDRGAPPEGGEAEQDSGERGPGPAEASGRLWVPGR
ncbi:MAG TPA: hypothetical protein VGX51_01680, partial [Solirubrobacteraceae bacterium]|jgi:hypothetical protein|nr:hypothetical protein [Solirubrobacteraceae bacterium]